MTKYSFKTLKYLGFKTFKIKVYFELNKSILVYKLFLRAFKEVIYGY